MKRLIRIISALVFLLLPAAFLLHMRYSVLVHEGYPTWEAVRNMLIRDGEIVIILPEGVTILDAKYDQAQTDISIDGQILTSKVGYGSYTILVDVEIKEQKHELHFHTQKLNNWNRIRIIPIAPTDPLSNFRKFENGVEKPQHVIRKRGQMIKI